jgi:hypothetical protein
VDNNRLAYYPGFATPRQRAGVHRDEKSVAAITMTVL